LHSLLVSPNLSSATAIHGVIPFDGEHSRDATEPRDRNATIWIVRASPAARLRSPNLEPLAAALRTIASVLPPPRLARSRWRRHDVTWGQERRDRIATQTVAPRRPGG